MQRSPTWVKESVLKKRTSNAAVIEPKKILNKLANGKKHNEYYKPLTSASFSTQS